MSVSRTAQDAPGSAHLYLREEQIRLTYEAMLLAWRELGFTCESVLQEHGLGAAHHRVMFLVATHPGMTMSELLRQLHITKQSLNRVIQDLVERHYLEQRTESRDRRLKRLHLTQTGQRVEIELFSALRDRMTSAYRVAGGPSVEGFRRVLANLQPEGHAA